MKLNVMLFGYSLIVNKVFVFVSLQKGEARVQVKINNWSEINIIMNTRSSTKPSNDLNSTLTVRYILDRLGQMQWFAGI